MFQGNDVIDVSSSMNRKSNSLVASEAIPEAKLIAQQHRNEAGMNKMRKSTSGQKIIKYKRLED